jgi:hypothetical protein
LILLIISKQSPAGSNSYMIGDFSSSAVFGPGEINETILTSAGSRDIFVAKFWFMSVDEIYLVIKEIEVLQTEGILTSGQANSLITKLESAIEKLAQGKPDAAVNKLQAFIREVNAFIKAKILAPEEGQSLIDAAYTIID